MLSAPTTLMWDTLVAPSASSTICSASEQQASLSAAVNALSEGDAPRPLASTSTVSLVDVQPSTVMALKETPTAALSAAARRSGSTAASVVQSASMVAMSGASMAAPLAMPPTVKPSPCTTTSLGTVSVVMMARAAAAAVLTARHAAGHDGGQVRLGLRPREGDADQTGLADEDLGGASADGRRHRAAQVRRGGPAPPAGGGVGVARGEDDAGRLARRSRPGGPG